MNKQKRTGGVWFVNPDYVDLSDLRGLLQDGEGIVRIAGDVQHPIYVEPSPRTWLTRLLIRLGL